METELYSIADIAKSINIPESTIRYYRKNFSDYIPVVGKGRTQKYPVEALEIFTLIATKLKTGVKRSDIETMLERFPIPANGETQIKPDLTAIQEGIESLRLELTGKFEEIAACAEPHYISDLLTLSDFKGRLEERFSAVFKEIGGLMEQFNLILNELATTNKKLYEISKLMQNQRDRDVTSALRKEKHQGWFKK